MFQAPIELPEGFVVDPAEAVANVTWNADSLSCVSERCLIETGPEPDEIGVQFAVRLQGTVTLLVSVSPVRNQYGQGEGLFLSFTMQRSIKLSIILMNRMIVRMSVTLRSRTLLSSRHFTAVLYR